jgi:hypothetical protein
VGAQYVNVSYRRGTARFVFYVANRIETASQAGDIRVLRSLLFPRFITKIELGYDRARIWYSFPLEMLAPNGVRGATATGSILTTFMIEGKKTRQHLKSEPKGSSERDVQIYELHRAGKAAREVGKMFGISESRVRAIYWAMKKQTKS